MKQQDRRRLAGELRSVCMRISRRARFENVATIAPHQFSVLAKLDSGSSTPRTLAELECVSAPSMTRTLTGLQERGALTRATDPQDRRRVVVTITDAGRRMLREGRRSRDEWMFERIRSLSDEECAVLREAQRILEGVVAR
ncbi:MarR family winged helix-turn-helix transcriptional regulator [Allobranchiibius sp. CTAmp26]|uniref:MarR family winged helix-turn-helix transcriptional regulator n=1 Tax=Allobranchiibius sp. CTAmp26 TaxID=2815214 RepID=UPI001AA0CB69|nr:MarR family transcriptional regulator [Allobranchiibius sp. CTAmp26]MBO1753584.1 MarR family transcriptional regulator [Allobranchiibius sp. CTAmp26]